MCVHIVVLSILHVDKIVNIVSLCVSLYVLLFCELVYDYLCFDNYRHNSSYYA